MANQIFVNLPVQDLDRSVRFFRSLGYAFDPRFTNENGTCLVLGESLFAMLLLPSFFETFTAKPTSDARKSSEVIVALQVESRGEVDRIVDAALAAGATSLREPQDHGFMYLRSFEDPDGHLWEHFWMDASKMPA